MDKAMIAVVIGSGILGGVMSSLGYGWSINGEYTVFSVGVNLAAVTIWTIICHTVAYLINNHKGKEADMLDSIEIQLDKKDNSRF